MLQNWGEMTKAQDDAQKINEAIEQAIAEHEADPESHMGEGESIENHRINEVADHPAGSVLADKWTMSEADITTYFENINIFSKTGNVSAIFPGVRITPVSSGSGGRSSLDVDLESRLITLFCGLEWLAQITFNADLWNTGEVLLNFGWGGTGFVKKGVGLELNQTNKRFYITDTDGNNISYLSWPTFSDADTYIIRIHNVPSENKVNIFINGELLGYLVWPDLEDSDAGHFTFASGKTGSYGGELNVLSLFFTIPPQEG